MAKDRPWYKRSGGDFVMGTLHMPIEARLAYSCIIDMLNDRDRPLPDDADFICGFTKLSKRKWREVREFLLNDHDAQGETRLQLTAHGDITNPRFARELAERRGTKEAAVEYGREGGRKSAAMRAAGQTELPLTDAKSPEKVPHKVAENARLSPDNSEIIDAATPENKDLGQAPPQPIRAREEARGERLEEKESSPTANPRPRVAPAVADDPFDMLALTHRLCRLGGVSMVRTTAHAVNMDIVKHWIAEGVDIEAIVVPAITAQFRDTRETTIGALSFYGARVAKLHADAVAKNGGRAPSRDWTPDQQAEYLERLNGSSTKPPTKPPDKRGK